MKWKTKANIIAYTIAAVIILFVLFIIANVRHLGYGSADDVVENGIEYNINILRWEASAATIILEEGVVQTKVVIPDRLENGMSVKRMGHITTGESHFVFTLEGKRWEDRTYMSYSSWEENSLPSEITDYYVTIVLGEKIKDADCMLLLEQRIYEVKDTGEYIRLNISYEVSPENKDYYSQDGKIYRK